MPVRFCLSTIASMETASAFLSMNTVASCARLRTPYIFRTERPRWIACILLAARSLRRLSSSRSRVSCMKARALTTPLGSEGDRRAAGSAGAPAVRTRARAAERWLATLAAEAARWRLPGRTGAIRRTDGAEAAAAVVVSKDGASWRGDDVLLCQSLARLLAAAVAAMPAAADADATAAGVRLGATRDGCAGRDEPRCKNWCFGTLASSFW